MGNLFLCRGHGFYKKLRLPIIYDMNFYRVPYFLGNTRQLSINLSSFLNIEVYNKKEKIKIKQPFRKYLQRP